MPSKIEVTESDAAGSPVIFTLDGTKRTLTANTPPASNKGVSFGIGANGQRELVIQSTPLQSLIRLGAIKSIGGMPAEGKSSGRLNVYGSNGEVRCALWGSDGSLSLRNTAGTETLKLDGAAGEIYFKNADCAEEFDISSQATEMIEPGTVMVIDNDGKLQVSSKQYDKRVAGVISGGGGFKPGIVLDRKKSRIMRAPLAMLGKVYCKVDADYSPIEVGDLLTTSPTVGHAMKADDPIKAFGSVIGKTLRSLKQGRGLIPILISMQ
jgi:hypothetical protein